MMNKMFGRSTREDEQQETQKNSENRREEQKNGRTEEEQGQQKRTNGIDHSGEAALYCSSASSA